jgi:hypothetical protein
MNAVLFLDFDGVLHPLWTPAPFNEWQLEVTFGPTPYAGPFFLHASALAAVLSPFLEHLEIGVSSTWGKGRTLDELRQLLPVPVADRVVDAVHHHLLPPDRAGKRSLGICRMSAPAKGATGWRLMTMPQDGRRPCSRSWCIASEIWEMPKRASDWRPLW